jgi:Mor family transcriptional regulator
MSRETDRTEALRRELVAAIVGGTGMREIMAVPLADTLLCYLQAEYGGQQLYIPAPPRTYPILQIEAELRRGEDPEDVRRRYNISRRTLYRLFPGGLPQRDDGLREAANA